MSGIDYKRHGYLFLLTNEVDVESFRARDRAAARLGVPSQLISPDDVKAMIPALETSTTCWRPRTARSTATPRRSRSCRRYAGVAAAQGVTILQGTSLDRIAVLGDKIVTIETSAGRIRTPTVICTAGVWSRDVGNLAGARHPGRAARPAGCTSRPRTAACPSELPLTVDFSTGFYFHREGEGLVFGGREPTIEGVASHGTRRLPVLAELPIQSSWWGFYEMSPDHNAIVGEVSQPRRFLYATGFSGHGFQQAPAVGEHLAELDRRGDAVARPLAALARPLRARRRAARTLRRLCEPMRVFVLARHGESQLNVERRINGDPDVPVPLSDRGQEEARRLGEQVEHFPLDACVHTRFPRTLETAVIALREREDVPLVVEARFDDIDIGDLEGERIEDYREWKHAHARTTPSREARASTTRRGVTPRGLPRAARLALALGARRHATRSRFATR